VDFSWGAGSPGSPVTSNFFSAKWTGRVKAPVTGTYTFTVTGDDGVRLFLNGAKVIDGWRDQGATPYSFTMNLTAGTLYDIELHYYEHEGDAACRLQWSYPGQTTEAIPQSQLYPTMEETPGTGLRGQYYNDDSNTPYPPDNPFTGSPVLTRTDTNVDFNWGNGSPGSPMTSNFFSANWVGQLKAPVSGTYTFTVTGDDGVRLFLNGVKVIDGWRDQGATPYSYTTTLTAGTRYDIELQYYEHDGDAVCRLQWSYPGQALQALPKSQLYPPQPPSTGYELDQENVPNGDSGGLEITRNQTVAQSFTVSTSGKLSRVDIIDIRHHRCPPQESLYISLINMSGDALGQTTYYTREVYPHEVNGTISLEFGSYAPTVSKGDRYAIYLKSAAEPGGCTYAWGGGFETYDGGDAFINGVKNIRDMKFRTYVTTP
jgi:hypothetical protein